MNLQPTKYWSVRNQSMCSKVKRKKMTHINMTFIQYYAWNYSQNNKAKEHLRGIQIGKEEIKLFLFGDDMN
jgi:hypothetical protein